nr:MAG TPA: hypothetical protein [Caudoviricetes sp.]
MLLPPPLLVSNLSPYRWLVNIVIVNRFRCRNEAETNIFVHALVKLNLFFTISHRGIEHLYLIFVHFSLPFVML